MIIGGVHAPSSSTSARALTRFSSISVSSTGPTLKSSHAPSAMVESADMSVRTKVDGDRFARHEAFGHHLPRRYKNCTVLALCELTIFSDGDHVTDPRPNPGGTPAQT